ncbi:MAG: efflux RND transporter permease subunit [Planctomycetes bacterium]|nr:efflux RND transporter permease subunit [Planctomycetota bacterium]
MLNALIRWSLRNSAAVLAAALLLAAFGTSVAFRMPVDVFPDLTAPTVTVLTEAHGMAPTEVESLITFPVEAAVNGASGVRRVRSSSAAGVSIVWVEFDWSTDIYAARQIVNEKLSVIAADLPEGIRPSLAPISSIMGEILFLSLVSDRHGLTELHTVADTVLRRRLLSVSGVAQVTPIGGGERRYEVCLDPALLRAQRVSLEEVMGALQISNENVSAGFLNDRGSEHLVTGIGRIRSLEDISETVVTLRNEVPVRVGQLGTVRIGEAPRRGEASAQGRPAVIIAVAKQPEANTLALTRELEAQIEDLGAKLPEGMKIDARIFRQADFIELALRNVRKALVEGGILVVFVVFLFLANARAALITLTAIPLSLFASVLALSACGAEINTMTLGGMAIAIGALVDDAIIDVENVFRRLRENALLPEERRRHALEVVYSASVEIRSSIVFATAIIVLVFVPLFFLPGVEGRLLMPLGLAYVVALSASLLVAVTVTPALCLLLLPRTRAAREGGEPRLTGALKSAYARLLDPVLARPRTVLAVSIALFAAAVVSAGFLGRSFLPEFNEGAYTLQTVTLPGTSLPESEVLGRAIDRILLAQPEVVKVGRRTGRAELSEHALGVEASEIDVTYELKDRSREEFVEALRRELALVPGTSVTLGQPISHRIDHMLSGTRASIAVKIFGDDLATLRRLAEEVREAMSEVPGVVDLSAEQQAEVPVLSVRFDRPSLVARGLSVGAVSRTVEAAIQGVAVSRVLEGQNSFDLAVLLRERDGGPPDPDTLGDLPLDLPDGGKVPLRTVARVSHESGPNMISREGVTRKIVVSCNTAGRDVGTVVAECRRRVDSIVAAEHGYRVEYGGQFQAAAEANRKLLWSGLAVVVGIGFLLNLAFGSWRDTILVMVNLPLALVGGVPAVALTGGVLSIASVIGFITLFGIATRNGIMLVSHIRHLHEDEAVENFPEAVRRGSVERLVPILMTALAAGLALVPLALGGGEPGNEIQTPMAIVVLWGLVSSTVLNMFVVPALYLRYGAPGVDAQEGVPS